MVHVVIKQCELGVTGNGKNVTTRLYDLRILIIANFPMTPLNPQILFQLTADVSKGNIIHNLVSNQKGHLGTRRSFMVL